jgi:hypothetical protein
MYRDKRWYVNRRALGTALARARSQGEADARNAEREWQRPDPDPYEHAGHEPVSLEFNRLED